MSVAKLWKAATRVHEAKSGSSARTEPSQYAQHYFAMVRRVYKGNPSKLKAAAEYEQSYMKSYSINDLDLQADGSSVWARDLPKPMDGVPMQPGDHVRVVKSTKALGLSAGAVGVIKRVAFWFQGLYDVDFQFDGKPELVRARVYVKHMKRGTFQVLAADATSSSDSTIGALTRFDGDPKFQGAPKTEGASGGRALTPFAKAYFKLWRAKAGMGEMDDVDALETQYRAGEITDADLLKNAPKSWHAKLPPITKESVAPSNFGFGEELAADIAMAKLIGHNFIDDGDLLESDGQDPGTKVRAQLAKMDALALEIRKGLNGLVREGIGMVEEASRVDLGEGTETLASMKPVLGRLMTAYTELVAGLQQARESVGYDVEGASVTSVPDEGEMQERITKRFARRATHGYLRESAAVEAKKSDADKARDLMVMGLWKKMSAQLKGTGYAKIDGKKHVVRMKPGGDVGGDLISLLKDGKDTALEDLSDAELKEMFLKSIKWLSQFERAWVQKNIDAIKALLPAA